MNLTEALIFARAIEKKNVVVSLLKTNLLILSKY